MRKTSRGYTEGQHGAGRTLIAGGVYGALTFCLWLKRLEAERFKAPPDIRDDAIELTAEELNWMLDGFDLWRNRPHKVLRPRYVA